MIIDYKWFGLGAAFGSACTVGIIALLDWFEDRKNKKEEHALEESEDDKKVLVDGLSIDGSTIINAEDISKGAWTYDTDKSTVVVSGDSGVNDGSSGDGGNFTRVGKRDYTRYYTDSLSNEVSESMANPLINPASLLEKDEDDESNEGSDISKVEGLLGQFFRDPDEEIPSSAEYLTYFTLDRVLCYDDDIQRALKLDNVFTMPIAAAIMNGIECDGQEMFVVVDAKRAKTYVVNVADRFWSDLPMN